jgi:hypothetical protein
MAEEHKHDFRGQVGRQWYCTICEVPLSAIHFETKVHKHEPVVFYSEGEDDPVWTACAECGEPLDNKEGALQLVDVIVR